MSNNIFEELPSRKSSEVKLGSDAAAGIEKKARQLVYDSRYEVKKMLAGKRADPATQERMILQRISKSTSIPAVKARARQMVSKKASVSEDFIPNIEDVAATSVAKAMFKVFVEGVEEAIPDYLEELHGLDDKKYKIRVTDPKTGNSYVRYGTREKITQLRAKGLKVEMTEYGDPREGERKRGESTAKALGGGRGGKKLDPVGKEDTDVDNDGKHNDPNDKYIMKRRKAIGAAIEKRKTVSASYEPEGEVLGENPLVGLGIGAGLAAGTALAGKMVYDKAKGVADKIKQQNDEKKKQIDTLLQRNSYQSEGELVESKKSKKHKKTTEPRWQDSDGDGKWYEPGQDVKKEDYLWTEGTDSTEGQNKGKITGKGVDNYSSGVVKVSPEDGTQSNMKGPKSVYAHTEIEGEMIAETGYSKFLVMLQEKSESQQQQKLFGLALSVKRGQTPRSEVSAEVLEIVDTMNEKEIRKFAKTKHKGLPEKVEEATDCGCDDTGSSKEKERDSRGDYTKINLIKNKLRSMGSKNPIVMVSGYEPEGEILDERRAEDRGKPRPKRDRAMEIVRSMPSTRQGLMTRSGKTVAQHEGERGVPERDRPKRPEQTTADRLALKKQKEQAAKAAAERAEREEERRRRLA
jgi:Protein of unknwon function (DUF3008)